MNFKYTFTYNNKFLQVRFISISKPLLAEPNDQDKLFKEVDVLQNEWDELDTELELLFKEIREEETDFEVANSDGETEGETEVSKYVSKREEEKDRMVGQYDDERDSALFDRNNPREDRSLLLEYISKTTSNDIETLESIEKQTSGAEGYYEKLIDTLDQLREHEAKANELLNKYHQNDLPPILPTEQPSLEERPPSNIEDYADTSTEMPSYMDPED